MQPHTYTLVPKPASLEELIQKAKTFVAAAKAPATLKAYRNDWRDFESWCREHQLPVAPLDAGDRCPLHCRPCLHIGIGHHRPPADLDHQGAPGRRLHRLSCHDPPLRRRRDAQRHPPHHRHRAARKGPASLGRHPPDRRRPARGPSRDFETPHLSWSDSRADFAGRSWQVSIYVTSSSQPTASSSPSASRRQTRRAPEGKWVCPLVPVRILARSAHCASGSTGPGFEKARSSGPVGRYGHVSRRGLHQDSIGKLLKRAAGRAGLKVEELGGHSLRAGCVTQAAMNGVREFVIMRQTGHKTIATLRRYIRSGEIFRENAAAGLGI